MNMCYAMKMRISCGYCLLHRMIKNTPDFLREDLRLHFFQTYILPKKVTLVMVAGLENLVMPERTVILDQTVSFELI